MVGAAGWITTGNIKFYANGPDDNAVPVTMGMFRGHNVAVTEIHVSPCSEADAVAFYTLNRPILEQYVPQATREDAAWTIAIRFWCVVAGLITTSKSAEWAVVAAPAAPHPDAAAWVPYALSWDTNAWTAASARAASWRKSNHATGGSPAAGYPRRWLQKMDLWPKQADRTRQATAATRVTSLYYWAVHPVSVHAVLALMLPTDRHHWAEVNVEHGVITEWDVRESTRIRMAPRDQVAGAALVIDSITVMRSLVKEGLSPLLANNAQLTALADAAQQVHSEGMRCGVYARWFFDGHPRGNEADFAPLLFSQRDTAFLDLAQELAIVATRLYASSTIGQSPSLANAASNSSDEGSKDTWGALARARRQATPGQVTRVVNLVRGSSTAGVAAALADADVDTAIAGIPAYNAAIAAHAAAVGLPAGYVLDTNQFRANFAATGAAAAPAGP
jgi:hypothetical protein